MGAELHRDPLPMIAASAFTRPTASNGAYGFRPVFVPAAGGERTVIPVASYNDNPIGFAAAGASLYGRSVAVHDQGIVKVVCGASIGVGGLVNIASSNGACGPVAAASGSLRYALGVAVSAAAAGEIFSVLVRPHVLSGVA